MRLVKRCTLFWGVFSEPIFERHFRNDVPSARRNLPVDEDSFDEVFSYPNVKLRSHC